VAIRKKREGQKGKRGRGMRLGDLGGGVEGERIHFFLFSLLH
jgi:hypothetical protein